MTTWADIRQLAADLQRVQLVEGAKRLSDSNCIEVVNKLIELSLVDLIFTVDGKEYVTRSHLRTQIRNECDANGGRIALTEIAQSLNIEYQHADDCAQSIIRDQDYQLRVGQLISRAYMDRFCAEVDERLQDEGRISLAQITKSYDLPSDLIREHVLDAVANGRIDGFHNDGYIYTNAYMAKQKALMRGALSATTKIIAIQKIGTDLSLPSQMLFGAIDELIEAKEICGQIVGGRYVDRAVFIPQIHTDLVQSFVNQQLLQDGYIDMNTVKKLGIAGDIVPYLRSVIPKHQLEDTIFLHSIALSGELWTQIVDAITIAIERTHWVEVTAHVPSAIANNTNDIHSISERIVKTCNDWSLTDETIVFSRQLAIACTKLLEPSVESRARDDAPNLATKLAKKDENVASKKVVKKKKQQRRNDDDDESTTTIDNSLLLSVTELMTMINKHHKAFFDQLPRALVDQIIDDIRPTLNQFYRSCIENVFLSSQQSSSQTQKRSHVDFQTQFIAIYNNICMFDTGANLFDEPVAIQLRQYLQRTLCTDAANMALAYICSLPTNLTMTSKVRDDSIAQLESISTRQAFTTLFASVGGKKDDLNAFFDAIDTVSAAGICSLSLKLPDKKLRIELLSKYTDELRRQLVECTDAATGLLLALLLLIADEFNVCVHASGKFVNHLIAKLTTTSTSSRLTNEIKSALNEMQTLVVNSVKNKDDMTLIERCDAHLLHLKSLILPVGQVLPM